MTIAEFITKWRKVHLKERSASQEHFCDLCIVLGHPTPAAGDPTGADFCFEKGATKQNGTTAGWADVWKRGFFGWEYKGKHADLERAYAQLQRYRESLENPPLLVVSDLDRIIIRTNFTNTPTVKYDIELDSIADPIHLRTLKSLFFDPEKLRPLKTIQRVTEDAAGRITDIAKALRKRGASPTRVARFLDRIVFCLFAQDTTLLPKGLFKQLVDNAYKEPLVFTQRITELFRVMATGGGFGVHSIAYFNGDLFADIEVLQLTEDELLRLRDLVSLNWGGIDASIFGTLFERAMDPGKREQLGAHYTSRADIEAIVEPVVMLPIRREWDNVRLEIEKSQEASNSTTTQRKKTQRRLRDFIYHLQNVKVLDPACGSGNFLYVVLQKLKDLEKEVILFAMEHGFPAFLPHVGPEQLYGIETNAYAYELAQMTVWIGWLQWTLANGFGEAQEPILQKLDSFAQRDAVLIMNPDGSATEPHWPKVDFIVGNPPFLGGKKMRTSLGDEYIDALFQVWRGRVPAEADFCCYWFEKARRHVEMGDCRRAGLLATQAIRGGANRLVLKRIKETGNIFFAESDRDWVLDGAHVHVSMVGFDDGTETSRVLDGTLVTDINPDLTSDVDLTLARRIPANTSISFMADTKGGPFDVEESTIMKWLAESNPHGRPSSDVLRPWVNGRDLSQRRRGMWIIDYPPDTEQADAARYEDSYQYVKKHVYPKRKGNRGTAEANQWWIHVRPRPEMRTALAQLPRFLATLTVGKHRIFTWLEGPTLPDHQLIVFARDDDYFFGVLHSRIHEVWARRKGTQLREKTSGSRYTPTATFETFPFPNPTTTQRAAISAAAKSLDEERRRWLNPDSMVKEHTLTFLASANGPWAHLISGSIKNNIGTARYTRLAPATYTDSQSLKKRTLTRLYNKSPDWLMMAHRALDGAVFQAYGWNADLTDAQIRSRLLELNLTLTSQG